MIQRPRSWSASDPLWRFKRDRELGRLHRPVGRSRNWRGRRPSRFHSAMRRSLPIILGSVVLAGFIALEFGPPLVGCGVKGNISPNTGERIYHVPGQSYYSQTRVNWLKGERWFCSEDAAEQAGWRRSRV